MAKVIHFEVYFQDTKGWVLQTRYGADGREDAVKEAKLLEKTIKKPVRVIRETHDHSTGDNEEIVVWKGTLPALPDNQRRGPGGSRVLLDPSLRSIGDEDESTGLKQTDKADAAARKSRKKASFATDLMTIMLKGIIIAAIGTGGSQKVLSNHYPNWDEHGLMLWILVLVFGLLFMIAVGILFYLNYPYREFLKQREQSSHPRAKPNSKAPAAVHPDDSLQMPRDEGPMGEAARRAAETDPADLGDDLKAPEIQPDPPPIYGDRVSAEIKMFISGAHASLNASHPPTDPYTRFGVNLYVAGACEALKQVHKLKQPLFTALIGDAHRLMGVVPEQPLRLSTYQLEERYNAMINAGHTAMVAHLRGDGNPFDPLPALFERWQHFKPSVQAASEVTLLVSDWMGNVEDNKPLTEAVSQGLRETHATLTRQALEQFSGRELVVSGSQITALFNDPLTAILAAMDIQTKARAYSDRATPMILRQRLAIHVSPAGDGEAVSKAAHQAAIALSEISRDGTVLISNLGRTLVPTSSGLQFKSLGSTLLRGTKDPQNIYTVQWSEST